MGGSLGGLFKSSQAVGASGATVPLFGGAGSPVSQGPSSGSQMGKGAIGGALRGFTQQQQPQGGPAQIAPGPAATPVDPGYFAPQQNQWNPQQRNPMSLYG